MKAGKSKRRRQQQQGSGRPVLVTFYIAWPTRDGGAAATASAHHHLHGGGHESRGVGSKQKVEGRSYNRRVELLEYSRHLRALAQQTTAATAATQPAAPPPRPSCRDTTNTVGVVPDTGYRQPAAEHRLSLSGRPHERTRSQQQRRQIRQRCFGDGGGWNWKRVPVLVFPFNSGSHSVLDGSKSKRPRRQHDYGRWESNTNNNQEGWPAALLLGKLTDRRTSRDRSGLGKKLISFFRQRS